MTTFYVVRHEAESNFEDDEIELFKNHDMLIEYLEENIRDVISIEQAKVVKLGGTIGEGKFNAYLQNDAYEVYVLAYDDEAQLVGYLCAFAEQLITFKRL